MLKTKLRILSVFIAVAVISAGSVFAAPYLTEPSFSPDRKEIVFVSSGDIWSVPAKGGTAQLLASHPATEGRPMFSPDGRHLAFVSNRTGNGDLYVLSIDAGTLRRVTFDDSPEQFDGWSRDGKWLYFSSASRDIAGMLDVFRVSAAGGTPMQVSSDRYTSEFQSAEGPGDQLAFAARGISAGQWWRNGRSHIDESEIWLKRGDVYEQIAARGAKQNWPMWGADGTRLYYVSDRSGVNNIWVHPLKGAAKALTNFTSGRVLWPGISQDGKEIVFEKDFRIWTLNTDSGKSAEVKIALRGAATGPLNERIALSGQISEMALSPDGRKAALVSRGEIFAVSTKDGGDAVRISKTAAPERYATWSGDSRKVLYSSERNGKMQIFQYDFTTESETRLTETGNDFLATVSPDGKSVAFLRNGRKLMVYDFSSKQEREICSLFSDAPPLVGKRSIAWSPDNKWIAFLTNSPESRSYTNVSVVSANGGSPNPVSFLANSNAGNISWSPDGTYILFGTGQRTEEGQIARIDLNLRTPKFREDQFRDLFKQENPRERPTQPTPTTQPTPLTQPTPAAVDDKKDEPKKSAEIVFANIRQRLSLIRTGVDVGNQVISPDGKTLLVAASSEGQFNFYSVSLDELATAQSARQITSTPGFKSDPQFSPDSKDVYFLENGRVSVVSLERREVRPLALTVEVNATFADEKMEVFRQGWRHMRDNFYDDKFHGKDWDAVQKVYEPLIQSARNIDEVRRLMNLMVGELNASHLGVGGASGFTATTIGKLGLRFDRAVYENSGRLRITEVIDLGPSAVSGVISVGDYLAAVDGIEINKSTNLDELLENKVGRRVVLTIAKDEAGTGKREVILKPVSTGAEKNLLYRQWVETNRAYVERISGDKIGYVHLPDMGEGSLNQLYIDLDTQNQARDGVVIDIRNNNGGFINPYVIDVIARKGYLKMTERGFWGVPARSALGQRSLERPTVLVTNQHSLSDAEDLTEGYRALKLGKVVGEPTSGWIIFTWNTTLFDGTTLRLPRQRVDGADGENMELNPRKVDVPVTRPIGETLTGKDSQLDAAVKELLQGASGPKK